MEIAREVLKIIAGLVGIVLFVGLAMSFFGFWPVVIFIAASALISFAVGAYR